MSIISETNPDPNIGLEAGPVMRDPQDLCYDCQTLDLDRLFEPPPKLPSGELDPDYALDSGIVLYCYQIFRALRNTECMLCRLTVKCGILSGLLEKANDETHDIRCTEKHFTNVDRRESRISGKDVICALRPKHTWKVSKNATSQPSGNSKPTLEHSGKIDIQFYELKGTLKMIRSEIEDGIKMGRLTQKSSITSWTIDVTFASQNSIASREPIKARADLRLVRHWLQECNHKHSHDVRVAGISMPISDLSLSRYLRAIHTTTGRICFISPNASFVALSYVWGANDNPRLYAADSRSEVNALADYPSTIRDAANLSEALGFEWLWVDRVYIDQSSESEKARLIPHMKDIFAAAELTIVAACGDGAQSGLLGVGETERVREHSFDLKYGPNIVRVLPAAVSFNSQLESSIWRTRGWTFEEHVFSRRLLYVFPSEIFFSCSKGTFREAAGQAFSTQSAGSTWGDGGRVPPTIAGELHSKFHSTTAQVGSSMTVREYVRAVEEYSNRGLTFEEDRVKAFAGLIAAATGARNSIDLAPYMTHGHPLRFFETLLTWHHEENHIHRTPTDDQVFAPSWSWASAGTKLYFLDNGEDHNKCRWFTYSLLPGGDILGIPIRAHTPPLFGMEIRFPGHIISEAPWQAEIDRELPSYEILEASTALLRIALPQAPSYLPRLHLVTLVFKARLKPAQDGQYSLESLSFYPVPGMTVVGRWSINADVIRPDGQLHVIRGRDQRIQGGQIYNFALVGGCDHLYIMLLHPEDGTNTFSRMGLYKQALMSGFARATRYIIRTGEPDWKYIRIV